MLLRTSLSRTEVYGFMFCMERSNPRRRAYFVCCDVTYTLLRVLLACQWAEYLVVSGAPLSELAVRIVQHQYGHALSTQQRQKSSNTWLVRQQLWYHTSWIGRSTKTYPGCYICHFWNAHFGSVGLVLGYTLSPKKLSLDDMSARDQLHRSSARDRQAGVLHSDLA
jgi:hypothetical protein